MRMRYCPDCERLRDVYEETVEGKEYIVCARCATVLAQIVFEWELPLDRPMSTDV